MKHISLLFGILLFTIFAFDLEYDRDVMTWMWLLESILFMGFPFFCFLKDEITKENN